jgi:hypothetical protein
MNIVNLNIHMALQKTFTSRNIEDYHIPHQSKLDIWASVYGKQSKTGECIACKNIIFVETFWCGFYISKSKGGTSDIKNIIPLCTGCYNQRNGRGVDEVAPHITVSAYLSKRQPKIQQSTGLLGASYPSSHHTPQQSSYHPSQTLSL